MNQPADVLDHIPPGADVIVPIGLGEPVTLLDALEANADLLDGVRIHRSLSARARALIEIAHPDHREGLRHEAEQAGLLN